MKKRYMFLVIAVALASLFIINFISQTRSIKLSDDFFNTLENTDFTDTDNLTALGFENQGDYYSYTNLKDDFICKVYVDYDANSKSGYVVSPDEQKGLKKRGNIEYTAKENSTGIFSLKRLRERLNGGVIVTREATFYKGNVSITVNEVNYEGSKPQFETVFK